jgi:hypothetical protein
MPPEHTPGHLHLPSMQALDWLNFAALQFFIVISIGDKFHY